MRVVVGLGNPGRRYAGSRHNAGFEVARLLAARWRIPLRNTGSLEIGAGRIAAVPVVVALPQAYMNRSGQALADLPLPTWGPRDLIVVYDDLDLPLGTVRLRHGGGSGGHRGVESIIAACGPDFDRVRIGIGRPPQGQDPADYVLEPPAPEEQAAWASSLARAADAVECLLEEGLEAAMNRFHSRSGHRQAAGTRSVEEPDEEENR